MGTESYSATLFKDLSYKINQPIGCANCHEANTLRLVVTNPALDEAFKKQGKNWQSFTRQEMRTVVCANCHVEYYFLGDKKVLTLPWEKGTKIENIEEYYNSYQFSDWTHKNSGAAMVKIQHPEYEMYSAASTHFNAGVACADCHMPYTRDGAVKFSSHDIKSPLLSPAQTCGTCHTDVDYVVTRVKIIQDSVHSTLIATEDALLAAIQAISQSALVPGVDMVKVEEARSLHRAAQMRWDLVAAENSMGFHNPEEALRILAAATDLARLAQIKAIESVGDPGSN
jgi:nitrite reductase (cytochrome c-552)